MSGVDYSRSNAREAPLRPNWSLTYESHDIFSMPYALPITTATLAASSFSFPTFLSFLYVFSISAVPDSCYASIMIYPYVHGYNHNVSDSRNITTYHHCEPCIVRYCRGVILFLSPRSPRSWFPSIATPIDAELTA